MARTNKGRVFAHVQSAVLVRDGSARLARRERSGPEFSAGGGMRGVRIVGAWDWGERMEEVSVRRRRALCCAGRRKDRMSGED